MMRRRSGRPLGAVSLSVLRLASVREVTVFDVARELQLSRGHASDTLFELKRGGYVHEVARRPVEGASRPVPVVRAAPPDPAGPLLGVLSLDWPR